MRTPSTPTYNSFAKSQQKAITVSPSQIELRQHKCNFRNEDHHLCSTSTGINSAFAAAVPAASSRDIWLHDDGASVHITNDINALFRYRPVSGLPIVKTEGSPVQPVGLSYIKLRILWQDDSVNEIVLENVLYIPGFPLNIYSGWLHDLRDGWDKHRVLYEADGSEVCQLLRGQNCLHLRTASSPYVLNTNDPSMRSSTFLLSPVADNVFPAAIHEAPVTLELLHRRLGHISFPNVQRTIKATLGLSYKPRNTDSNLDVTTLCDPCKFSKPKKVIRRYPRNRESKWGDRFYADVFFCNPVGYNGHTAGMIFTDGKTGGRYGYTFPEKRNAFDALVTFTRFFRTQNGFLPKCFCLDGGKEFGGDKMVAWCQQYGIAIELTTAYFHEQGGPQERSNRTVLDPMRCVISDMRIPFSLWPEIFRAVIYILNCITTSVYDNMTP